MKQLVLTALMAIGLFGCGGDDEDASVTDQPLQGEVNGQAWTLGSATTNAFLSDDDTIWVDAYLDADITCDSFGGGEGASLILNVPREVGTYTLSLSLNMTFVFEDEEGDLLNVVGTNGVLIVEEVTDTQVTASIRASADGDNSVEGRFTAELCPSR